MENIEEIWKDIKEFDGNYQVSNHGRVRSTHRVIRKTDNTTYTRISKILKPATDGCGYHRCAVSFNGKLTTKKVHRLVASAFIGGMTEERNQVNHKDGNKKNNFASNLEWVTRSENCQHSFDIGIQKPKRGQLNGMSIVTEDQVVKIRKERIALNTSYAKLGKKYGIAKKTCMQICKRETWPHVR